MSVTSCSSEKLSTNERETFIYLYSPRMNSSSCSTRCLICTTICLSVVFLTILTVLIVYHQQNKSVGNNSDVQHWSMKIINDRSSTKKRQSIDLTEDETKICDDVENYFVKQRAELFHKRQEKWQSFQEQIDRLLIETDERNETSIHRFYRLCRKESSDVLNKEVEKFFQNLIEEEPFRSFLTLIKRNRSSTLNSNQFFANPFFKIESLTPKEYRIVRIDRTPFPVDANIFFDSKFADLNRTAWFELVQFEETYRRIIEDEKKFIEIYSNEFNEDSLIVRRISQISNYEKCRKTFRQTTGIEILIEMINDYIENVLPEINRKYLERQIDSLHKIKDNRTLVQRFRRIQIELNTIDRLLSTNRTSKSCLIDLLGNLFDRRMNRNDLPNIFDDFLPKNEKLFFVSDDWPFFVMLIDRFLKNWSRNVFVNSIFYETYHRTIFPYYFPHRSISNFSSFESCRIESCLDILLCFHPDSIEHLINKQFQNYFDSIRRSFQRLVDRFRFLVEQSDDLFSSEKEQILDRLENLELFFGSERKSSKSTFDLKSDSYLDFVLRFSSSSSEEKFVENLQVHSIVVSHFDLFRSNSNRSIEFSFVRILFNLIRQTIGRNPFRLECSNSFSDGNQEEIFYFVSRDEFLSDFNVHLDRHLWPFNSRISSLKHFLIDYGNDYFSRESSVKNNFLIDDFHLVFRCSQQDFIDKSKCTIT